MWNVGEVVTAAIMNVHVRDNQVELKSLLDGLAGTFFAKTLDYQLNTAGNWNSGTTETTLFSFPVPANTWNVNGRRVRATISGQFNTNSNPKILRVYLGGTGGSKLWDSGTTTINDLNYLIEVEIVREGVGSQYATTSGLWGKGAPAAQVQSEDRATGNRDETTELAIVVTGESSSGSNQLFATSMLTELAA